MVIVHLLTWLIKEASYGPVHEYNLRNNYPIKLLILGQNDSADLLRLNITDN